MTGTLVNVATVLAGSAVGLAVGAHLPERLHRTIFDGLGLASWLVGITMIVAEQAGMRPNIPLVVGCVLAGGILGEWWRIEDRVEQLGMWLKQQTGSRSPTFVEGFVTASILFCVGAMTIVGSIEDGARHDPSLLLTKAAMDGFASLLLATNLGIGVAFSALTVLVVQGSLTLLATQLDVLLDPSVLAQVRGAGGVLILGVGLSLLQIRKLRLLNFTPALLLVIVAQLGLNRLTESTVGP